MKKLYLINELRYQAKYLLWYLLRLLEVRTTSGITKYLADDKPHCSTTYSGEAERGCLVLDLKPFCIYIRQEGKPPETKTYQAKTHESCHSAEASALIISQAEMLFRIPDTQFCSEAHGIKGDDLPGSQCELPAYAGTGEQDNVFPCSLNHHHTHLLNDIPNPYVSCHHVKSSQLAIDEYCDTFCWVALEQVCQLPFLALSGFSPWSSHLLLTRWQWWFWFWVIPPHCILAHTRYHMDGYPKHPVDEWRLSEVSISYYTHGYMLQWIIQRMLQHCRELGNEWANSIPEVHCLCNAVGMTTNPMGLVLPEIKLASMGKHIGVHSLAMNVAPSNPTRAQ